MDIFEAGARNYFRSVTGKSFSRRIDEHQSATPAAHAGLGKARVVIGYDEIDADASREAFSAAETASTAFFSCSRVGSSTARFFNARHSIACGRSPCGRGQVADERDYLFEVIDILAMDDEVYGEGDFVAADERATIQSCARELLLQRSSWPRLRANPESSAGCDRVRHRPAPATSPSARPMPEVMRLV